MAELNRLREANQRLESEIAALKVKANSRPSSPGRSRLEDNLEKLHYEKEVLEDQVRQLQTRLNQVTDVSSLLYVYLNN